MDFSRVGINIAVENESFFFLEKMDLIILFVKSNPICALLYLLYLTPNLHLTQCR